MATEEELKHKQDQLAFDKEKFNKEQDVKAKEHEFDKQKFLLEQEKFRFDREKFEHTRSKDIFDMIKLRNDTIKQTLDIVNTMNAIKNDISFESETNYDSMKARFVGRELDCHEEDIYAAAAVSVVRMLNGLSIDSNLRSTNNLPLVDKSSKADS